MGGQESSEKLANRQSSRWHTVWLIAKVVQARLRFVAVLVVVGAVILYWPRLDVRWESFL